MVARLNAELKKILAMPEMEKKISDLGAEVRIGSPEDFASWMKSNVATWGMVIREAGVKVE
jgi:tripartite-type tricarboxylate transporter receptor subunit TctC